MSTRPPRSEFSTSFPLLDLPPELRLMIYEYLPNETDSYHRRLNKETHYIIETTRALTAILHTCSGIHNEARNIIGEKVATATSIPPRIIVPRWSDETFRTIDGLYFFIHDHYCFPSDIHNSVKDHITTSRGPAFGKRITRLARFWPKLDIVLPINRLVHQVCPDRSRIWRFLQMLDRIGRWKGLEPTIWLRPGQFLSEERERLRRDFSFHDMKIIVKMFEG
jgi:hypothetical protein